MPSSLFVNRSRSSASCFALLVGRRATDRARMGVVDDRLLRRWEILQAHHASARAGLGEGELALLTDMHEIHPAAASGEDEPRHRADLFFLEDR